MTTARLTIVLPVCDDEVGTLACLEALESCGAQTPFELVLVDRGASPAVRDLLERLEGDVAVVPAGAEVIDTELVAELDSSTVVGAGWPDALVAALDADPTAAAATPLVVGSDGSVVAAGLVDGAAYGAGDRWPTAPWYTYGRHCDGATVGAVVRRSAGDGPVLYEPAAVVTHPALPAPGTTDHAAVIGPCVLEVGDVTRVVDGPAFPAATPPENVDAATAALWRKAHTPNLAALLVRLRPESVVTTDPVALATVALFRSDPGTAGVMPAMPVTEGLTSIVVRNSTKACLDLVHRYSRAPYEVVERVEEARGEFVIVMDGRARVSRRWLDGLIGAFNDPAVSAVGPRIGGDPRSSSEAARAAEDRRRAQRGRRTEVESLDDFCIAYRAGASGGTLVIAEEVLVHGAGEPLISACLIVKDEEERLPDCLLSLGELVDEIVVGDTGSSDLTRAMAEAAGCRVIDVPWTDDFAAARNAVVEHARGRWILSIDADERVRCDHVTEVRALLGRVQENVIQLRISSLKSERPEDGILYEHWLERLFVRGQYRFHGRMHEGLAPVDGAEPRAGRMQELSLLHVGYTESVFAERSKGERNHRLAEAFYDEGNGERWYRAYVRAGSAADPAERAAYYEECIEHLPPTHDKFRVQAGAELARAYQDSGRPEQALAAAERALAEMPEENQALLAKARALRALDRVDESITILRRLVAGEARAEGLVVNRSIERVEAPLELGRTLLSAGRAAEAVDVLLPMATAAGRFTGWPDLVAALAERRPDAWVDDVIAALGDRDPATVLASDVGVAPEQRLALAERFVADGHAAAALAVFEAADALGDDVRGAAEARLLDLLGGWPQVAIAHLARRLETRAPGAALAMWERFPTLPGAAVGRARCHVALDRLDLAADALVDVDLTTLTAADVLFVATLALGLGDAGLAADLLDVLPADVEDVAVEDIVSLAQLLGPDVATRTERRFAARLAEAAR